MGNQTGGPASSRLSALTLLVCGQDATLSLNVRVILARYRWALTAVSTATLVRWVLLPHPPDEATESRGDAPCHLLEAPHWHKSRSGHGAGTKTGRSGPGHARVFSHRLTAAVHTTACLFLCNWSCFVRPRCVALSRLCPDPDSMVRLLSLITLLS